MVWPFSRGRAKRLSDHTQSSTVSEKDHHAPPFSPTNPRNATPRSAPRSPGASPIRKRRRSPDKALELEGRPDPRRHRSRNSVDQTITALPGSRRMDPSPHLRRTSAHRAAIPYNTHPVPASRLAAMAAHSTSNLADKKTRAGSGQQKRRLSKRVEAHKRAIREEEVRAMSAPIPIPKRPSGNGAILDRDNKTARRHFSSKHNDDGRGSNVSLPFQESIHSSMSGVSEQKGWAVRGLGVLSPRPSVRLASSMPHGSSSSAAQGLPRDDSHRKKLARVTEGVKRKDRRRVAELADGLDAADLRLLMERDSRRKEQHDLSEKDRLEAKLRKRAERDARRAAEASAIPPVPPVDVHPAFRGQNIHGTETTTLGQAPPTPTSDKEDVLRSPPSPDLRQDSVAVERSPFRDHSPSSAYSDPFKSGADREDTPQALFATTPAMTTPSLTTPLESPAEDPVLHTAQAVRYSQGRMSQVSTSPPTSPVRGDFPRNMSPLRREFTPDLAPFSNPSSPRESESVLNKKPGTWASIFRRGTNRSPQPPPAGTLFSNTSRDSMSKPGIPAHLVGNTSRRTSATPTRTQSIFREHLPESPASPPDSRVNSRVNTPDILATAQIAAAGGPKRAVNGDDASPHARGISPETNSVARTESPNGTDGRTSTLAMSNSLASIDSEGSWLTGRPSKRRSNTSHLRNSVGSGRRTLENPSYEDLGVADEEYVRRLTPSPEDNGAKMVTDMTPINEQAEGMLLRRDTSRRKPRVIYRDEGARSREGLVAEVESGISPISQDAESHRGSVSELDSDTDQVHEPSWNEQSQVTYGKGHARQLSSGSAKLLDIRPRSGRSTPDARMSMASGSELQSTNIPTPTASTSKL